MSMLIFALSSGHNEPSRVKIGSIETEISVKCTQSVDYCITLESGLTDDVIMSDDFIALFRPIAPCFNPKRRGDCGLIGRFFAFLAIMWVGIRSPSSGLPIRTMFAFFSSIITQIDAA